MIGYTDKELADLAARSRRLHREKDPRPAVRRIFREKNIPIVRGPGSRYLAVLAILRDRAHAKLRKMHEVGLLPSPAQRRAAERRRNRPQRVEIVFPKTLFDLTAPAGR